jgi:hypothetical protein
VKDITYDELEHVFKKFTRYHIKILLGEFNDEVDKEEILKLANGNESLHKIGNDGVRVVNFATSKSLIVKSTMFPHCNIHKYTWTSLDG